MRLQERISSFLKLGQQIKALRESEFSDLALRVENNNPWFTPEQTKFALEGLSEFLDETVLIEWLQAYNIPENTSPKTIGLLMAGNIPAVGFHDLMCVLISGHVPHIKLSSSDQVLIPWIVHELIKINPGFSSKIIFSEMLRGKDAYIATGSDNSSRYFDYYFGKFPSIIRKNRTAIGILKGAEQKEDLQALGRDIFQYFGLGCRNVSKLYIPESAPLQDFLAAIGNFPNLLSHHKYLNNYEYNKAIYLVNGEPHLDNGFLLIKESRELVSPISVLFYEIYSDHPDLHQKIEAHAQKIQCIASKDGWYPGSLDFGLAQKPRIDDYADRIDTIKFLTSL